MAIKLGGGGSGAQINEIRFFVDQGDLFTDPDGAVWLKKGVRTLDTTTYPDAYAINTAVSRTNDYKSTSGGGQFPFVLTAAADSEWALGNYRTSSNQYVYRNITEDTVQTLAWPGTFSGTALLGTAYIKCSAPSGVNSNVANANNYFMAVTTPYTTSPQGTQIFTGYLYGGSTSQAGRLLSSYSSVVLEDTSGNRITPTTRMPIHWDTANRKFYLMATSSGQSCVLYVYDWSSQAWGYTGPNNIIGTANHASQQIDWHTQAGTGVISFQTMSASATHLYVNYRDAYLAFKLRKIPLSGNLSWSSGTDVGFPTGSILLQDDAGNFSTTTVRDGSFAYYKTVGSTEKFLAVNSSGRLYEFSGSALIGETTPDPDAAKTQYQRIK